MRGTKQIMFCEGDEVWNFMVCRYKLQHVDLELDSKTFHIKKDYNNSQQY